jgi:hypothetical protein
MKQEDKNMIQEALKVLSSRGLRVSNDFVKSPERCDGDIVEQMIYFLTLIQNEGATLTKIGNLPVKIVKSFVLNAKGAQEDFYGKRYTEEDSMATRWIHTVAEMSKLVTKRHGVLSLSKKGKTFLMLSPSHQWIFLFESIASHVNLGYIDGYRVDGFVQDLMSVALMTALNMDGWFSVDDVVDKMIDHYPEIDKMIAYNIPNEQGFITRSSREIFVNVVELRLFERYFKMFGLVESREKERFIKEWQITALAKRVFLNPGLKPINKDVTMISGNVIKETKQAFESCGYRVDLFDEFILCSSVLARKDFVHFGPVAEQALNRYHVKSKDYGPFIEIYTGYFNAIAVYYDYLLNDLHMEEGELMQKMKSLGSALYHAIPATLTPTLFFRAYEKIPERIFDFLVSYGADTLAKDFLEEIKQKLGPFVYDKAEHVFMLMTSLQKECHKVKRINKDLENDLKMLIISYIVLCWDVMLYRYENEDLEG